MPLKYPSPGPNWVPEYQIAAVPWTTSTTTPAVGVNKHEFYRLTSWVTIINNHATNNIQVAFADGGFRSSNFFVIPAATSEKLFLRLKTLFVSGSDGASAYSIVAGITGIKPAMQTTYTGSNDYQGIG